MPLSSDLVAIGLTLKLAAVTTLLIVCAGTPVAWWLASTRSPLKSWIAAFVSLPLVLPPVVLGFYLLLVLGPDGPVGRTMTALGLERLPFTFAGLVVASMLSSLPFVVQPLQNAFEGVPVRALEAAATLGAGPLDRFVSVAVPLSAGGYVAAAVLAFAHTVGEFGVVLMIGGNIPGTTRVLSVALFDHVESLEYREAHRLAAAAVALSLAVLLVLHSFRARPKLL